jgi:cyclase
MALSSKAVLACVAFFLSTATLNAQAIEKVKLADDIYLFRAPSDLDYWTSSNSVVVINEDDVTVFDTNARPSTSRLVLAEIRKLTNKPVRLLVNSHWHMDHWMGNEVYAKAFPGLEIIATTETRDYMKRMPPQYFVDESGYARQQAALDSAIKRGTMVDGSPLTAAKRQEMERDTRTAAAFASEIGATSHVLPNVTFGDSLIVWRGSREYRFFNVVGDASGCTALYLPKERMLLTGDVLVRAEDGQGGQPWTTNSYKITPWLRSLREFNALDVSVIVPGQGPPLDDKTYLQNTIAMYESIIAQVHAALEGGAYRLSQVQAAVKLDAIRERFTRGDSKLNARFDAVAGALIRRVYQESHDGLATP